MASHSIYTVRLPLGLRDKLEQLAQVQDRNPSDIVRRLIRLEVERVFGDDANGHDDRQSEPVKVSQ
jgi:predicted transcriptional regulator